MRRAPLKSLLNPWSALIAVVLIVNVVVFTVSTSERWSASRGVSGATTMIRDARESVEPRLQVARDTYGRLVSAENDFQAFRADLVTATEPSELMAMLVRAGANAGIVVDDATFQLVPLDELGVVQLGINLPVVGSYEAVRAFLDELVALPVFLVIDGVGLQVAVASTAAAEESETGAETVRVELAFSVFVDDPELTASSSAGRVAVGSPSRPSRSSVQEARLQAAARGDDPEELSEALLDRLASLPPLPVDPEALVLYLDRLDQPVDTAEPQRNLFSVVLPPAPPPAEEESVEIVEPEPVLPVTLLGVMMIEGRWHASLSDGADLFVAESGDNLPNGVEVLEVGADYADVMFDDKRTRLRLEGNER